MAAASPLVSHIPCHMADKNHVLPFAWKNAIPILEQHRPSLRYFPGQSMVGLRVKGTVPADTAGLQHQCQYSVHRLIYIKLRQGPFLYSSKHCLFHIGTAARHIQIAAGPECSYPVIHGSPVGHYQAVKSPFFPQYLGQQPMVITAKHTVKAGVSTHYGPGMPFLHSNLKAPEIDFPQSSLICQAIAVVPESLLVIGSKVLETARHAFRLFPANPGSSQFTGKQRIFRKVLKIPAAPWIPIDIGSGSQNR